MKRTNGNTPRQVQQSAFPACMFFYFSPPSREVLCELKQSHWVHTDVSLVCSSVFISLSISQIASCHPAQLCFFRAQDLPISKQTDVSISTAHGWLWCAACLPACRRVNSNSNSSVLLSSVCSSYCTGCQNGSLLPPKKGGKQYIFLFVETDGYTLKFNSVMQ